MVSQAYLVVLCLLWAVVCAFDASTYTESTQLAPLNYTVYWRVDIPNNALYIALKANTLGWVGFGISEPSSGSMQGSDIMVGYHDSTTGKGYVTDMWSYARVMPETDDCQNVVLVSSEETADGYTIIEVKRPINTSDLQDRSIAFGANRVIGSFSADGTDTFGYHSANRQTGEIIFFGEVLWGSDSSSDGDFTIDLRMNQYAPPVASTTVYACQAFVMPTDREYFITQVDPIIANVGHVHHILAHVCINQSTSGVPYVTRYYNSPNQCSSPLGRETAGCVSLLTGWAAGGSSTYVPDDVGFPMGPDANSIQFIVLEVHYNNPLGASTPPYVDTSGLKIHYTSTPKKYEASMMVLGDAFTSFPLIPANTIKEYESECLGQCTSAWTNDIVVFNSFPHMHLVGSKLWTTQWRDGEMIDTLARVDFWAFDHQLVQPINKTVRIGDRLNTHCVYDTTGMTAPVRFGAPTTDEMCMHFVSYYPRMYTPQSDPYTFCGYILNNTLCGAAISQDGVYGGNPIDYDPTSNSITQFGMSGNCTASPSPSPSPTSTPAPNASGASLFSPSVLMLFCVYFLCAVLYL